MDFCASYILIFLVLRAKSFGDSDQFILSYTLAWRDGEASDMYKFKA